MEAKITIETMFDESMIVQEINGASHGESLVQSVIRLKEEGTRKALAELGYMEPAEAKALRARVAELEARSAVVPELPELLKVPMGTALQRLGHRLTQILDGHEFAVLEHEFLNPALEEMQKLSIQSDRVLGEVDQFGVGFVEACGILAAKPFDRPTLAAGLIREGGAISALAETPSDGPGISVLRAEMRTDLDALRANQGGAVT